MDAVDHGLEFLLSLDGYEYELASGYRVKIAAARTQVTAGQPHGISYSLTLHAPNGRRIYGIDNAHRAGRGRAFDHRHVCGGGRVVGYVWRGPVGLLLDFYREVERILNERGR